MCPDTAPNKHSKVPPNVAEILSNGCGGISTRYMHVPGESLMGGIQRNGTKHIVRYKTSLLTHVLVIFSRQGSALNCQSRCQL